MAGIDRSSFERDFEAALAYALKALGNDDLALKKEQKDAMATVFMVRTCFYGYQQGLESLYVTKAYHSHLISNWVALVSVIVAQ